MDLSDHVKIEKDTVWRFRRLNQFDTYLYRTINIVQEKNFRDAMGSVIAFGVCRIIEGPLKGNFRYLKSDDSHSIDIPWKEYAIYLPRNSVTKALTLGVNLDIHFFLTTDPQADDLFAGFDRAMIFPFSGPLPQTLIQVKSLVANCAESVDIEFCHQPRLITQRLKRRIEQNLTFNERMGDVASEYRTSSTVLGRMFRQDFGLSPTEYRNHLRIVRCSLDLIHGSRIVDTYQEFGFEDLSQFYRVFKRVTKARPREYKPKDMSKITKK
ncbi:MAG: AraC family transcriptional regulator [Proteobacteria bacterium]|nr:AraC family transcriptional regulator [Pseudomonadota bacterium]